MDRSNAALALSVLALAMAVATAIVVSTMTGELGVTNLDQLELDARSSSAVLDIDQTGTGPLLVLRKAGTPMMVVNATGVPILALAPATMTPTPTNTPTATVTPSPTP